jgi:hypothetical protein
VPEEEGRFQVDEVGDRKERAVETLARQDHGERRLGVDDGIPHPDGVETREDDVGLGLEQVGQRRVEVSAAPLARELFRGLDSANPVCDLDELGDVRKAGRERDLLALEVARPAASVPARVGRADCLDDLVRQGKLLSHASRDGGVMGDHVVDLTVSGERELEPEPKSV